ncbi:predicted protein [Plenodomus lingam JN3]|uniref:Uncharacterized protein n=1 Tax=Leptosphaeria maculans (strain JN3 / isolate v23.1.3 / race Av1-4-5-6-7-8) TaxID=985895 RepID=E5A6V4_LEPMJ|nr:predicted protein [Plenodomus lingam JN3]CBX99349.1 predicted protein [Plenodomus lingam JN3]
MGACHGYEGLPHGRPRRQEHHRLHPPAHCLASAQGRPDGKEHVGARGRYGSQSCI